MNNNTNPDNMLQMCGRIVSITELPEGKCAFFKLAVDAGLDRQGRKRDSYFIGVKTFEPSSVKAARIGTKVRVHGHVASGRYEKEGQTFYYQNLYADQLDILEDRAVIEERARRKALSMEME